MVEQGRELETLILFTSFLSGQGSYLLNLIGCCLPLLHSSLVETPRPCSLKCGLQAGSIGIIWLECSISGPIQSLHFPWIPE